jgi:hypothetical protein
MTTSGGPAMAPHSVRNVSFAGYQEFNLMVEGHASGGTPQLQEQDSNGG